MNLLSLLLGGAQTASQGQPAPQQGDPTQGDPSQAPIEVTGDTWKPHNASVLGQIADYFLGTHFGRHTEDVNMEEATRGFNSDPMRAINRVAQFNAPAAWKLRNQEMDNTRQQGSLDRQNRVFDAMNENLTYQRAAGAMSKATPDNWSAMRAQILKMAQGRHVDMTDLIPEQYDPTSIDTMMNGAVPVAKQMQMGETAKHHRATEGIEQQNADTRQNYDAGVLEQGGARVGIGQQNADTSVTNSQTSSRREQFEERTGGQGIGINTRYGPGMVSKDGTTMTLYPHSDAAPAGYDGKGLHYIRLGNKWVPANTAKK